MSFEVLALATLSLLIVIILSLTALRRVLGFVGAAAWSMFPVYGAYLPEGAGLAILLGFLVVIAVVVSGREKVRLWMPGALGFAILLAVFVTTRELIDPSELGAQWLRLTASVGIAFFLGFIGYAVKWRAGFAWGLVPGGVLLSAAEIARVASGGLIHAREAAFGLNPIVLGQYAAVAAIVVVFQILRGVWRWPAWAIFILPIGGLVATASRGPLLGAGLALVYLLLTAKREGSTTRAPRIVGFVLIIVVAALLLMNMNADLAGWLRIDDDDRNAGSRLDAWSGAWKTIGHDWLWGGGPGRYFEGGYGPASGLPEYPHNIALELWSEYGAVAALLLVGVIVLAWRNATVHGEAFIIFGAVAFSFSGGLSTSLVFWMMIAVAASTRGLLDGAINPSDSRVLRDGNRTFH